jgi:hypothetical protein
MRSGTLLIMNQFRNHIGTTHVAIDEVGVVVGFATLAALESSPNPMRKAKRRRDDPIPTSRLAPCLIGNRRTRSAVIEKVAGLSQWVRCKVDHLAAWRV